MIESVQSALIPNLESRHLLESIQKVMAFISKELMMKTTFGPCVWVIITVRFVSENLSGGFGSGSEPTQNTTSLSNG